ncbi:hypothetical protein [Arcobacter sp. LA11]|uniref:hypothetical protein n=1 Tax=Arcobacter sp. LA11 TaxID=1898176 RepID=UPI001576A4B1|nr:hypothetical protein [Arcobacter sp. LA11]
MSKIVLGSSIVLALLFVGCGLKRDCDLKDKKCFKNKSLKIEDRNQTKKKAYIGE